MRYHQFKRRLGIRQNRIILAIVTAFSLIGGLGSSCGDKGTESTGDKTPPTFVSSIPANSASSVAIGTTIQVTFSEPIDSNDLTTTVFAILPSFPLNFSQIGNTVVITPVSPLIYSTNYTLNVSTELSDTAGNNLAEAFTISFQTESDPNLIPPTVTPGWPFANATDVSVDVDISANFSKPMNPATITTSTFSIAGVAGTVGYLSQVATFKPDSLLEYATTYNIAITTAVADTFGIAIEERLSWSFTTRTNPLVPVVTFDLPQDSSIIDDTITVYAAVNPVSGQDSLQFYVNGIHDTTVTSGNFFLLDLSATQLGSQNKIIAKAYDNQGNVGVSDTLIVYHKWQPLGVDFDPIGGIPQDMQLAFYRPNDSILEFRFEFLTAWGANPVADTSLDLAIFFDTDQSALTGRVSFGAGSLNDIGAEKRVIIGIHGATALATYNSGNNGWDSLAGPEIFSGMNLAPDTTILEFGLRWTDLDNAQSVDLLAINAFFVDTESAVFDWMPNEGAEHFTIKRVNRYTGAGLPVPVSAKLRTGTIITLPPNPFD